MNHVLSFHAQPNLQLNAGLQSHHFHTHTKIDEHADMFKRIWRQNYICFRKNWLNLLISFSKYCNHIAYLLIAQTFKGKMFLISS